MHIMIFGYNIDKSFRKKTTGHARECALIGKARTSLVLDVISSVVPVPGFIRPISLH